VLNDRYQKGPRKFAPNFLVSVDNGFCSGTPSHLSVYTGTRLYVWSLFPRYRIVEMVGIPLPDFSLGGH
jgi:hypothetical protein